MFVVWFVLLTAVSTISAPVTSSHPAGSHTDNVYIQRYDFC